jgi:hypothetical protein
MDSAKGKTENSVFFKKHEGRWVPWPVNDNGSVGSNRSTYTISTRQRYLSSEGKKITI